MGRCMCGLIWKSIWDILKDLTLIESRNTKTVQRYENQSAACICTVVWSKAFCSMSLLQGLTSTRGGGVLRLCTELVSDGEKSIIISSHITEDLDRIADYIAYMQAGEAVVLSLRMLRVSIFG